MRQFIDYILKTYSIKNGNFGWMGKNIYNSTQLIDKRLTIVESTLINRTEAVKRLAVLEHRVDNLERR